MKVSRRLVSFVAVLSIMSIATRPAHVLAVEPDEIFADNFSSFSLLISNTLSWCTVTETGANAYSPNFSFTFSSSSSSQWFDVDTVVQLSATPNPGFLPAIWTGTDTGQGTNVNASVTMSAARSVTVCCPLPNGSGC